MNTERLNSWLTLGANVGVIIGLLFLAYEINQSTRATEAAASDSVVDGFNTLALSIIEDPDVARIFYVGMHSPEQLTDVEAVQFAMWMRAFINQHMRLYRLAGLGLFPAEERQADIVQLAGILSTPGGKAFLDSNLEVFPPYLLADLEPHLGKPGNSDFILGRKAPNFDRPSVDP